MTIQRRLARFARDVDFDSLPAPVVDWAKSVVLDTLGCAMSGHDSPPVRAGRSVFEQLGGVPESTVIGNGARLPCCSAAWINGTMARYEDLNDTYPIEGRLGHFSEVIPTALAVGEREDVSGRDLLAAIVVGYEVLAATTFHGPQVGVGFATFGSIASPVVAGALLGLSEDEIVSAIGISLSSNVTLVSWLGPAAGSMLKASTWAANAHHGILAALLAGEGFSGPETAIETYLERVDVSHPETALPRPGQFGVHEQTMLKRYAAQMFILGPIETVLALARENAISAADIEAIVVSGTSDLLRYAGGPEAARPESREAADHSAAYALAIALIEGDVLPQQYRQAQWADPDVQRLVAKVECVVDPELDRRASATGSMPSRVVIRTRTAVYSSELESPRGHPDNPMDGREIEEKFRRVVDPCLDVGKQDALVELVDGLETTTARALMRATVF
jgi:2-methylcitrate dehydratase